MVERTLYVGDRESPTRIIADPIAIEQPALAEMLTYWRGKRGEQRIPQYAQFAAREIARHLGSIMVADALPDCSNFRYRLVGSRVTRYFLSDATGKTVDDEFAGELGQFLVALNRQACIDGTPIRLTGPAAIVEGVLFPDYDTLYLPWAAGDQGYKVVSLFAFDESGLAARSVAAESLPPAYRSLRVTSADDLVRDPSRRS
jgi:hypothetical protein